MEITMREYLREKKALRFENGEIFKSFLRKCEREGITWIDGSKATSFPVSDSINVYVIEYENDCLAYSFAEHWGEAFKTIEIYKEEKQVFKIWEAIEYLNAHKTAEFTDKYNRTLKLAGDSIAIFNEKGENIDMWFPYVQWELKVEEKTLTFLEVLKNANPEDLIQMRFEEHNTVYMNITNLMHYIGSEFDEKEFHRLISQAKFKLM